MMNFFKNFSKDEDGAVTVDWVVLTAAVVGLGIAGVATIQGGIDSAATTISADIGTNADNTLSAEQ
jgi:Flp pilus assembly pilin Flp